jgi:hypothetical protein
MILGLLLHDRFDWLMQFGSAEILIAGIAIGAMRAWIATAGGLLTVDDMAE